LFFRSSPSGSQSQSQSQSLQRPAANGVNGSSPLRQQLDAGSSQGGRTPRASGAIGGKRRQLFAFGKIKTDLGFQNLRRFTMPPAQMLLNPRIMGSAQIAPAPAACSFALHSLEPHLALVTDDMTSTRIFSSQAAAVDDVCSLTRTAYLYLMPVQKQGLSRISIPIPQMQTCSVVNLAGSFGVPMSPSRTHSRL
jgi:hypothetical protein